MLCPKCHDQVLVVIEREGIEIDYCGGCRGVWLDRGELEKLISQAAASEAARADVPLRSSRPEYVPDYRERDRDDDDDRYDRRKRRGGFLGELFDFD